MSALVATQIVNGRMGVSAQWLEECRIISMGALRQMEHRQRAIPLTRGGRGVLKIYEYNTLPMAIKEKIDAVVNVYNESGDAAFIEGMRIIRDAYKPTLSKQFVKVEVRGAENEWKPISMNMTNCEAYAGKQSE